MQEISIAEPLAASGETVISPTVVAALGGEVSQISIISFHAFPRRVTFLSRILGWC